MIQESYLRILKESLEKKIELLNKIIVRNDQQHRIFESEERLADELDENMEAKSRLVDQILAIDDGFDSLFKNVQDEIENNKDKYRDEIIEMKSLISEITRLSSKVETQEKQNLKLAQKYFSVNKASIKAGRMNSAAAAKYYQNMMGTGAVSPQFMDKKE